MTALTTFAVAAALHAGFQMTVTLVVYPALTAVDADRWARVHAAHGVAITPLVALVYACLVISGALAALADTTNAWLWVGLGGALVAILTTAVVAGPTHSRLAARPEPALLRRLVAADRVRTLGAVTALIGAITALG